MIFIDQLEPIALQLGPIAIHWYGLMYLLGFIAAYLLARSRLRKGRLPGVDIGGFGDLLLGAIVGVMLGGRLGYILFYDLGSYLADPIMMLQIWKGGMSFHGGLIGVGVAMAIWAYRHKLHFFDTMDFIAPLVPPGLGFGRIGNFINGELWGKYTDAGWGVIFPAAEPELAGMRPEQIQAQLDNGLIDHLARHPSQLYQAALEGLALFALLWWFSRKPRGRYAISGLFALGYGVARFLVEFVRVPDEQLSYIAFGWLTMGQLLSLPLIIGGTILLALSVNAPVMEPKLPENQNSDPSEEDDDASEESTEVSPHDAGDQGTGRSVDQTDDPEPSDQT